jgi:hypothetical protein
MKRNHIGKFLIEGIYSLRKRVKVLGPCKDVITVVSALVVLASFVIKDAWGEHLKELAEGIESAESRFESDDRWVEEQETFSRLISQSMRPGLNPASDWWMVIYDSYSNVHLKLIYVERLSKVISVRELSDRRDQLKREESEVGKRIQELQTAKKGSDDPDVQKLALDTTKLVGKTVVLDDGISKKAEDIRRWNERYHTMFTWISYLLFAFGWILSLASNLAGVESKKYE